MSDPKSADPLYRVFHLNIAGGIDYADVLEASDDEDAIGRVQALAKDHAVELWDRARFVAKVEPPMNAMVMAPVVVRAVVQPPESAPPLDTSVSEPIRKMAH